MFVWELQYEFVHSKPSEGPPRQLRAEVDSEWAVHGQNRILIYLTGETSGVLTLIGDEAQNTVTSSLCFKVGNFHNGVVSVVETAAWKPVTDIQITVIEQC